MFLVYEHYQDYDFADLTHFGVFTTLELAKEFIESHPDKDDLQIEEVAIDPPIVSASDNE